MTSVESNDHRLPSTGAVLAFIVDCLGIPKKTDAYDYYELRRLRKGGLATDNYWEVARKAMDAIVGSFMGAGATHKTETVLKQKFSAPVRRVFWRQHNGVFIPVPEFGAPAEAIYWKRDAAGELEDFGEVLLHDWTEFLFRHEFLAGECGSTESPSLKAILPWACMFVVPFLAQNLIEYIRNDSRLERGMPGGRFWYLPQLIPSEDADGQNPHFKWPVNAVLDWWQDLLGVELISHSCLLCAQGDDPDNARRQVYAWQHENRPPDRATVERWCKIDWADRYAGAFVDDTNLPLPERWNRCRAFLVGKGFHKETGNWLQAAKREQREMFEKQYRGEPLEREILPFKQTAFAAFFDSPDPIMAGLPVNELINRVAERWSQPTNEQLKARFLMAAAFQRAFTKCVDSVGIHWAVHIVNCFEEVYCFLMDLNNRGGNANEIVRSLRDTPEPQLRLRFFCEWLFDEGCWRTLPNEIGAVLKS